MAGLVMFLDVTEEDVSRAVAVVPLTALAVAGAPLFPSEFKVLQSAVTDKVRSYSTQSVFKVVLQKSIPPQIRQLILYVSNSQQ